MRVVPALLLMACLVGCSAVREPEPPTDELTQTAASPAAPAPARIPAATPAPQPTATPRPAPSVTPSPAPKATGKQPSPAPTKAPGKK